MRSRLALAGVLCACLAGRARGGEAAVAPHAPGAQPTRLRWEHLRSALRRDGARPPAPQPRHRKRNVLILMSDTGGGHRASALALKAAMEELHPNRLNVTIVDMYASCSSLPFRWLPQMYRRLTKRPLQWRLTVHLFADFKPVRWFMEQWIHFSSATGLRACLEALQPEVVVSMHAMTSLYPLAALRRLGGGTRRIPVVTVVTDLTTVHPAWFDKNVDVCFVASEEAAALARAKGLRASQLRLYGLPIHPAFGRRPRGKGSLRRRIGAAPNKPLVLLVGGGDGVGGLGRLAECVAAELGRRFPGEAQLMVVCGKNEKVGGGGPRGRAPRATRARASATRPHLAAPAARCLAGALRAGWQGVGRRGGARARIRAAHVRVHGRGRRDHHQGGAGHRDGGRLAGSARHALGLPAAAGGGQRRVRRAGRLWRLLAQAVRHRKDSRRMARTRGARARARARAHRR